MSIRKEEEKKEYLMIQKKKLKNLYGQNDIIIKKYLFL